MMDVELILNKLQDLELVRLSRPVGEYYQIYCPIHNNGQERKPSCGVLLHDQYKNGKMQKAGFFHCFSGETEVITNQGIKQMRTICGVPVQVINGNGDWETVVFRDYGVDQLWKLTLSRDQQTKVVYATKDHEWFVKRRPTTCITESLVPGMYLESLIMNPKPFKLVLDAIIYGIIYGDGTRNTRYKSYGSGANRIYDKHHPVAVSYAINIPKFSKKLN